MTQNEFNELKVGDWIASIGNGNKYRVIGKHPMFDVTQDSENDDSQQSVGASVASNWERCDPPMVDWIDAYNAMRNGRRVRHRLWNPSRFIQFMDGAIVWNSGNPYVLGNLSRNKEWHILP